MITLQGHMLRVDDDYSLFMTYHDYATKIPLPCGSLILYSMIKLTLKLEAKESAWHSVLGGLVQEGVRVTTMMDLNVTSSALPLASRTLISVLGNVIAIV